ncbi:MAG TPA: penicillin acylase family protein [Chitinophagaceae bacterium]|nr:penicillin acylase family protein [Chitinophagaceae bacterium]
MKILLFLLVPIQLLSQAFTPAEIQRWQLQSKKVTIVRDTWGIPHVYGKTDADAVFGLMYAQCEDDFKRVEMNYIEKLGRMAEVKGAPLLYDDLLIRLVIDSAEARADFAKCPLWLQDLMYAFADGINYYLYKHPSVQPALLHRFQPWYPLLWTDGSIGAINTAGVNETELKNFYTGGNAAVTAITPAEAPVTGSNGFAFSPQITASHNAILYINPHVTFYFRPEVHMVSEQGLNVYGAVTWGQFFIYQGFNEHCGWMHTSSAVDIADLYKEKLTRKNGRLYYEYNHAQQPVKEKKITLRYGQADTISINALFTKHGPIMTKRNGEYLSVKANNRSVKGLVQSWQRTKANSFAAYKKTMDLLANTSNNTVYADAEGNIAYWHGNFIPVRDTRYNWSRPVDGTTPAMEWKGLHPVGESVHVYNPANGWLQNCNSTPFTVAGANSPKKDNYPAYMAPDAENYRGINAVRVLAAEKSYTLDKVIAAGYNRTLSAFEDLVPALLKAFDSRRTENDSLSSLLQGPVAVLRAWDFRCADTSVATTLAIEWAQRLLPTVSKTYFSDPYTVFDLVAAVRKFAANAPAADLLQPFAATIRDLQQKQGSWQVAWGSINRFQRISADIDQVYDDSKPSLPVAFASSLWGMLPSYNANYYPGTSKRYGVNGNSFICAVEFGKRIKAKSLLAGGESGDPASPHFNDQLAMYAKGQFKEVFFYKEDVLKHAEKTYHPGD